MDLNGPGRRSLVIMIISTIMAITSVILRFWAKSLKGRITWKLSDYAIVVGMVFAGAESVLSWVGIIKYGIGQHTTNLEPQNIISIAQIFISAAYLWIISTTSIKLSLLFLYFNLFPSTNFRRGAYIVLGFVLAYFAAMVLVYSLDCRPFAYRWNKEIDGGHCGNIPAEETSSAVVNMIIDLVIMVLPTPVIWKLQMPLRKKVSISAIFSLGFIIVVLMAIRIYFTISTEHDPDISYALNNIGLFTTLEVNLGIVVACLPTMQPVLGKFYHVAKTRFSSKASEHDRYADSNTPGTESYYSDAFGKSAFKRLDDDFTYPLTQRVNVAADPSSMSSIADSSEEPGMPVSSKVINVRTDIGVSTEPSGV